MVRGRATTQSIGILIRGRATTLIDLAHARGRATTLVNSTSARGRATTLVYFLRGYGVSSETLRRPVLGPQGQNHFEISLTPIVKMKARFAKHSKVVNAFFAYPRWYCLYFVYVLSMCCLYFVYVSLFCTCFV